jgi:hypothetical protein
LAAAAAGTVFLAVQLVLMGLLLQISPALSLRYLASLLMGSDAVTDTSIGVLIAGLLVHYALSLAFTTLIAVVVHRGGLLGGIVGGAILGLSLYSINLYFMTRYFPWFFALNTPALLIAHIAFGAVAGGVYELFDHYDGEAAQEVA